MAVNTDPKPAAVWPGGMWVNDGEVRTLDCGCVFRGWFREGNDRPFCTVFDTGGWTLTDRCPTHQSSFLARQAAESERRAARQAEESERRAARQAEESERLQRIERLSSLEMRPVPIKDALLSLRHAGLYSGNSDRWVTCHVLRKLQPLRAHLRKNRWYVNGNALDAIGREEWIDMRA